MFHSTSECKTIWDKITTLYGIVGGDEIFDRSPITAAKQRRTAKAQALDEKPEEGFNMLQASLFEGLSNFIRGLLTQRNESVDEEAIKEDARSWFSYLTSLNEVHSSTELLELAWRPLAADGIKRGGCWKECMGLSFVFVSSVQANYRPRQ